VQPLQAQPIPVSSFLLLRDVPVAALDVPVAALDVPVAALAWPIGRRHAPITVVAGT